jgi:tubulin beta
MGTKYLEVVCDEHGIGGSGEDFGNNDAHLDGINILYNEAFGGKYLPCAVLFDLDPA